jgi:hypothetical protein
MMPSLTLDDALSKDGLDRLDESLADQEAADEACKRRQDRRTLEVTSCDGHHDENPNSTAGP